MKLIPPDPSASFFLKRFPVVVELSEDEIKHYGIKEFGNIKDCRVYEICSRFGPHTKDWAYDTFHQRLYLRSEEQAMILKLRLEF